MADKSTTFLVAVDGSYPSLAALKEAVTMAKPVDARVVAVYVEEETPLLLLEKEAEIVADEKIHPDHFDPLAVAVEYGEKSGVKVEPIKIHGYISGSILKIAEDENAEMIFVGESGRGGIQRLALGSVAEGVARHSNVPVVIVKRKSLDIGDVMEIVRKAPKIDLEAQKPESHEIPSVFRPSLFYRRMLISFTFMGVFLVYYLLTTAINSPAFSDIASIEVANMPLGLFLAFIIYPFAWILSWIFVRTWR